MLADIDWIIANHTPDTKYTYFWNQTAPDPRACFNQWHPSKFSHKGFMFSNAEQAMMADKAAMFNDFGTLAEIFNCPSPRAVKALGRQVHGYVDAKWAAERLQRVVYINVSKFTQNPIMKAALLATGSSILVEASPEDTIWGIGLTESDPRAADPNTWLGTNLLGTALMQVRYILSALEDEPLSQSH